MRGKPLIHIAATGPEGFRNGTAVHHDVAIVGLARVKVVRALVSAAAETPDPSAALRSAQRDGDEEAFRVLYRAVHPGLLR